MSRLGLLAAGLALGLTGAAQAEQTPPAKACEVQVGSRTGGAIAVVPASEIKGATAPQVIWQPIATGPGVILLITYGEGGLTHMDEPTSVLIRFRTPGSRADSLSVSVKARGGRAWRFDGSSIVSDASNQAHIAFGLDWPYGRGVISGRRRGPTAVGVGGAGRPGAGVLSLRPGQHRRARHPAGPGAGQVRGGRSRVLRHRAPRGLTSQANAAAPPDSAA